MAPIALYPDTLLSQVLMASTYPLEVVEAARWLKENPRSPARRCRTRCRSRLGSGRQALTAVPQTLQMMDKLDWTQELGDVFLAQQAECSTRCSVCARAPMPPAT